MSDERERERERERAWRIFEEFDFVSKICIFFVAIELYSLVQVQMILILLKGYERHKKAKMIGHVIYFLKLSLYFDVRSR